MNVNTGVFSYQANTKINEPKTIATENNPLYLILDFYFSN
jgi:hypothetical protein